MDFTPASQNGVKPVDQLYSKPSPHLLIANTNTTGFGQGVYVKCINTAPYPKDVPAEFFATVYASGNSVTQTILKPGINAKQYHYGGVSATLNAFEDTPLGDRLVFVVGSNTTTNALTSGTALKTIAGDLDIGFVFPNQDLLAPYNENDNGIGTWTWIVLTEGPYSTATNTIIDNLVGAGAAFLADGWVLTTSTTSTQTTFEPVGDPIETVSIGTSTFVGATATVYLHDIPTGTNILSVYWPGESKWEGFRTTMTNAISVAPGIPLGKPITISVSPYPAVVDEPVTFRATTTASSAIMNGSKEDWYFNTVDRGYSYFTGTSTVFTTTFATTATETVFGRWNGGLLNGNYYIGQDSNTLTLPVNERGVLYTSLSLSASPNPTNSHYPFNLTVQLNTSTIFTGTTVSISGNSNGVKTTTSITTSSPFYSTSSFSVYNTGTQVGYSPSPGVYTIRHQQGEVSTTSKTVISTATSTSTSTVRILNVIGYVDNVTITNNTVSTTIVTTTSTNYENPYSVPNLQGYPEGMSVYITITGNNPWTYQTNTLLEGFTFKSSGYWWVIKPPVITIGNSQNYTGSIIPINVPAGQNPSTATLVSGYFNFYSGQALTTQTTTATTLTTVSKSQVNSTFIINTNTTLINNISTFNVPANVLSTGTYTFSAVWQGTTVTPKYYPITSNTIQEVLLPVLPTTTTASISPSTITYFTSSATAINNNISNTVTVTGGYSTHPPTGIITISDSITGFITTGTLTTGSNAISISNINWTPSVTVLSPGTRQLIISYGGDDYNLSSSTSTSLTINQSPAFVYLGNQGYISTGSLAGYFVGPIQVNAKFGNASVAPATVTFHAGNQTFDANVVNGVATISTGDFNYYGQTWSVTYPTNAYYSGANTVTMPAKQSPNISVMVDSRQVTYNRNANPNLPPNQTPITEDFFKYVAPNWTVQGYWDAFYNPSYQYPELGNEIGLTTGTYIALENQWVIFSIDKVLEVPNQYNIDQTVTINYYQNPTQTNDSPPPATRPFIGTNVNGWDFMHTYTFTVTNAGGTIAIPKYLSLPNPPYSDPRYVNHPVNMSPGNHQYSIAGTFIDSTISTTTDYMTVTGPYNPVFVHGGIITANGYGRGFTGVIVDIIYSGNNILGPTYFRAYGDGGNPGLGEPPLPAGTRSTSTFIIN
jgi:hypothetical protein